jgi:hypothetical protein
MKTIQSMPGNVVDVSELLETYPSRRIVGSYPRVRFFSELNVNFVKSVIAQKQTYGCYQYPSWEDEMENVTPDLDDPVEIRRKRERSLRQWTRLGNHFESSWWSSYLDRQ